MVENFLSVYVKHWALFWPVHDLVGGFIAFQHM